MKFDEIYIFDSKEYCELLKKNIKEICFIDENEILKIYPHLSENNLQLGYLSTFSGFYFKNRKSNIHMQKVLKMMFDWCIDSYKYYEIKFPPEYIDSNLYEIFDLINKNLKLNKTIEVNQHLAHNNLDFNHHFSDTNKKIVRRSIHKNIKVNISKKLNKDGYDLLKRNRESKNRSLSIDFNTLDELSNKINGKYIFFECITEDNNLIAYAVTVKIKDNILYVLYWGEEPSEKLGSPVVYLAKNIIDYCILYKIEIIDAGISSLNGIINTGLYNFKQRLGFKESNKYIIRNPNA